MALRVWGRTIFIATLLMLVLAVFCAPLALAEGTSPQSLLIEESLRFQRHVGSVRGLVYQDWDEDGEWDPEEPALAGATLSLVDAQGATVGSALTDDDGLYRFKNVQPGEYTLIETPPLGYSSLGETQVRVTVQAHEVSVVNFGNVLWLLTPGVGPVEG